MNGLDSCPPCMKNNFCIIERMTFDYPITSADYYWNHIDLSIKAYLCYNLFYEENLLWSLYHKQIEQKCDRTWLTGIMIQRLAFPV